MPHQCLSLTRGCTKNNTFLHHPFVIITLYARLSFYPSITGPTLSTIGTRAVENFISSRSRFPAGLSRKKDGNAETSPLSPCLTDTLIEACIQLRLRKSPFSMMTSWRRGSGYAAPGRPPTFGPTAGMPEKQESYSRPTRSRPGFSVFAPGFHLAGHT